MFIELSESEFGFVKIPDKAFDVNELVRNVKIWKCIEKFAKFWNCID